ncbi:peroxidase family protein [Luteolibacter sp. LG18]|uniref:peroxidase family protein n=1 Tax=Luteolibacter sp. LG18 TaxID=2819286 RepID=UPI002B2FA73C|nr:peroxidase [Luteolibacter sp. LG18]
MHDSRYSRKHGLIERLLDGLLVRTYRAVNRRTPWHKLPSWLGLGNLIAFRVELRKHNLHDTDGDLTQPKPGCPFHPGPYPTLMRTPGGTQNDLNQPAMGCRYSRLGRNMIPLDPVKVESDLYKPNPLKISKELLARDSALPDGGFQPATSLNLLAAAWIQFQVHDWFNHENEPAGQEGSLTVPRDGDWPDEGGMKIRATLPDPTNSDPLNARYPAFRNADPQWWDGSQIYGESEDETLGLRTDPNPGGKLCPSGKLYLDPSNLLPSDPVTGQTVSGFTNNWWLGLEILHTLFVKEHNAICSALAAGEPQLNDQQIFERARLVNCALMAKIHTIEWTPGILAHPAIKPALDANWMGLVGHWFGEELARRIAVFLPDGVIKDIFTGVPGSEPDHHGAPYCLTEEFASVYRLHPLIPETVTVRLCVDDHQVKTYPMEAIAFNRARAPLGEGATMTDAIYTFGTSHPGAITIGNYPSFLRNLKLPAVKSLVAGAPDIEEVLDLAAVDILRDRERGVPRYNEFRKQLRMPEVTSWLELSGGRQELADKLERIYGTLDQVDTMVGMFCEPLPEGFGFSDTAFRIFILMASRRLKSDRFFTTDYHEEVYTRTGMEWIRKTGMKEIICRHHPELEPAFANVKNPFAPWTKAAGGAA